MGPINRPLGCSSSLGVFFWDIGLFKAQGPARLVVKWRQDVKLSFHFPELSAMKYRELQSEGSVGLKLKVLEALVGEDVGFCCEIQTC